MRLRKSRFAACFGYQVNVAALKQTFKIPLTTFTEWVKTVDWIRA